MQNKFTESGRTLMEMIAVLVVAAILLIGGLLGYSAVVHKYKKDQTVKQISELSVRYKLRPVKPESTLVPIKTIYPEAERADATTMKTADTSSGRVSLKVEDTSAFSVVVNNVLDDSCEAFLENGDYDAVLYNESGEFSDSNEYLAIGIEVLKNWDKNPDQRPQDLKGKSKKEVISVLCKAEGGKVRHTSLVYGDKCSKQVASYWYSGRCWTCPKDQKEDKLGNCCSSRDLNSCGICNDKAGECKVSGCPGANKTVCDESSKQCVECSSDANCECRGDRKFCDATTHTCVECKTPGATCTNVAGETGYCTRNHTCEPCDTTNPLRPMMWDSALDICVCKTPRLALNAACEQDANGSCCVEGTTCHEGTCVGCWLDYDYEHPELEGSCSADRPLCKEGSCQGCPVTPTSSGAECSGLCGCDGSKGLSCALSEGSTFGTCQCSDNKYWYTETCVECYANYGAAEGACLDLSKPKCDLTTNTCQNCGLDYWNENTKTCTSCLGNYGAGIGACTSEAQPVCNTTNWTCKPCDSGTFWNSTTKTCTSCLRNYQVAGNGACTSEDNPVCDKDDTWTCKPCDSGTFWNENTKTCTSCLVNKGYGNGECTTDALPVCNTTNWTCQACLADKPNWDPTTKTCVECIQTEDCEGNKVCDSETKTCVECLGNTNCVGRTDGKIICNTTTNTCECPTGKTWDVIFKSCVDCITTSTCPTCPTEKPYWNDGQCVKCQDNICTCASYRDCEDGYFCDMTQSAKESKICSSSPRNGICREANTKTVGGNNYYSYQGKTSVSPQGAMDWWTAMDFCAAIGKNGVSMDERCSNSESTSIKTNRWGTCANWRLDSDGADYWTTDIWKNDSCYAFDITFSAADVYMGNGGTPGMSGYTRNYSYDRDSNRYALCQKTNIECFESDKIYPIELNANGCCVENTAKGKICPKNKKECIPTCKGTCTNEICCPTGSNWDTTQNACVTTATLSASSEATKYCTRFANTCVPCTPGTNCEAVKYGDYYCFAESHPKTLMIQFPSTITSGRWQILGTDTKAKISADVQLFPCSKRSASLTLVNNTISLDSVGISGFEYKDIHEFCSGGLGQNLTTSLSKSSNIVTARFVSGTLGKNCATNTTEATVYKSSIELKKID